MKTRPIRVASVSSAAGLLLLAACTTTTEYHVPSTPAAPAFKEAAGWSAAAPADALDRGPWWEAFDDPVLSALVQRVQVSNQTVAAAVAAYDQARAALREQRAALFPSVSLNGSGTRSGGQGRTASANSYQLGIGASWEPDVWGRLRSGVDAADASAQASAADLAAALLAAQGELVTAYLGLRQADAQEALLDATLKDYERALQITQNRYDAGIVAKTDLLQAQTQLASAKSDRVGLQLTRAQYEHAVAVLAGETPSAFALAATPWQPVVPAVPPVLPSELLQRRPDIAAAERAVAAANAQIGVARAAYFPSFGLTASGGFGASRLGDLLQASSSLWAFGLSAAQVLFDGGAIRARVAGAEAAQAQAAARYRQTVLSAFRDVEDQLAALTVLAQQYELQRQASAAADQVEQQILNRYRAGQAVYTDVVTAQVTARSARRTLVQTMASRQTAAVALIQALGGGWRAGADPGFNLAESDAGRGHTADP